MKKSLIVALLFSVAGIYVSTELIDQSVSFELTGKTECTGGNDGCLKAQKSDYSKLYGTEIPIAVFGLGFYLAAALMAFASFFWKSEEDNLIRTLLVGSGAASVASIFLGIVSLRDGYLCPYCATLYGINFSLFAAAFIAFPRRSEEGFSSIAQLPTSFAFWTTALLLSASIPTSIYHHQTTLNAGKKVRALELDAKRKIEAEKLKKQIAQQKAEAAAVRNAGQKIDDSPSKTPAPQTPSQANQLPQMSPVAFETRGRPIRGAKNTPITVVEFADFQCGYCQQFGKSLKAALKAAPGKFNYVFKHFPLDSKCNPGIEPGGPPRLSCDAAYAMICAGRDGKAWEMHDLIFDNQRALTATSFNGFANELGISLTTFDACMKAPETKNLVLADVTEGMKANIQGTPAVFINGIKTAPELDGARLGALLSTLSDQFK